VLEEAGRFGASRYTPSREPFHSCRIWRTVSSIREASDSACPSRSACSARSTASWTTRPAHMCRVPSCFST
jgi:hypothetical protein